jgi:DNA (cytosine-5)-methyltransferase 1
MRALSLFSGIGGFDLAAEWAGVEVVGMVEIDKFCQRVLKKHWPNVKLIADIYDVKGDEFGTIDILYGGFPCQSFSCAGKRRGTKDDRYLWPEMFRIIQAVHPQWIIAENVPGLISIEDGMVFENVCLDLERERYEVQPFIIGAVSVNAPHRRDRVWIVAHSLSDTERSAYRGNIRECVRRRQEQNISKRDEVGGDITDNDCHAPDTETTGLSKCGFKSRQHQATEGFRTEYNNREVMSDTEKLRLQGGIKSLRKEGQKSNDELLYGCCGNWNEPWLEVATRLCTLDDGLPNGLARPKGWRVNALKGVGNAVVPQIPYIIMKAILEVERYGNK